MATAKAMGKRKGKRKAIVPALADWSAVDVVLGQLCEIEARRDMMTGEMNEALARLRADFQAELDRLASEAKSREAQVQQYCEAHRAEFAQKRSRELTHGTVSFRFSPPSCVLLNRKWKWESVKQAVKGAANSVLRKCIRVKEEIDKEAILAAYAAKKTSTAEMADVGVKIASQETFGIELKYEEPADDGPKEAA